jgi:hypothetical protein
MIMAGDAARKFATAQDRLRRIERLIQPYAVRQEGPEVPPRADWVPGDYIGKKASERLNSKEKEAALKSK